MMNLKEFTMNLWRWKCGLPQFYNLERVDDLDKLKRTEFNYGFIKLCANRMIQGRFRYGSLRKSKVDYLYIEKFIRNRLRAFMETGNSEFLCDISNAAMIEFTNKTHPDWHFETHHRREG